MTQPPPAPPAPRWRLLLLLVLPLLVIGPALLPGKRFLPQLPVMFEPLASEHPEAAARAWREANLDASDGLFPLLTDERAMRAQLLAGRWPRWDETCGIGAPLASASMATPWNPLRWPFLLLPADLARGPHALLAWWLLGLGTLLLLERRVRWEAALCGALVAQSCGYAVANLHLLPKLDAALWLPFALLGAELAFAQAPRKGGLLLAASLGASALAGFPPVFAFVAATTALRIFALAWEAPLRVSARVAGFAAAGVLLGGAYLVPMAEWAARSTRGAQDVERVAAQSLPPSALVGLTSAGAFGSPKDRTPLAETSVAETLTSDPARLAAGNRVEWSVFVGALALALAAAGLVARGGGARFAALLLVVALGFQFGLPGVRWLYALKPLALGSPARAGALAGLAWAWLAALGLDALLGGARRARLAFLVALLAAGGGTAVFEGVERARGVLQPGVQPALALVAGGALLALARRGAVRAAFATAGVALLAAGYVAAAPWGGGMTVESELGVVPPSPAMQRIAEVTGDGDVMRLALRDGLDEVLRLSRPGLPQAYGIGDLTPYVALPDGALVAVLGELDPNGRYRSGWAALTDPGRLDAPWLDDLGVTCVLSAWDLEALPPTVAEHDVPAGAVELVDVLTGANGAALRLYRRPSSVAEPARLRAAPLEREGQGLLVTLAGLAVLTQLALFAVPRSR